MTGEQEGDGDAREVTSYKTMCWASLDAKTAFDVAEPDMIAGLPKETMDVHG